MRRCEKMCVKKDLMINDKNEVKRGGRRRAFTLIELLVVIAIIAILAALLLPALSRARFRGKLISDVSNYRQWATAVNLYSADYKERLPSIMNVGGQSFGNNIWDVSKMFPTNLALYGMTIPMWFCPIRPMEYDGPGNAATKSIPGFITYLSNHPNPDGSPARPTLPSLMKWLEAKYSGESLMDANWWVPRPSGQSLGSANDYFPRRVPGWTNTSTSTYDWPMKTSDRCVSMVPVISDLCFAGESGDTKYGTPMTRNITDINPVTAHFLNGKLHSVNAAYADGRVETRVPKQIEGRWQGGTAVWFY
jgi:prepilin-type N-terminal cleavage/methylation domain-containing protein